MQTDEEKARQRKADDARRPRAEEKEGLQKVLRKRTRERVKIARAAYMVHQIAAVISKIAETDEEREQLLDEVAGDAPELREALARLVS